MLKIVSILFLVSGVPVLASNVADKGVSLENETSKLELVRVLGKLDTKQTKRLAELYFMTSRCSDAMDLLSNKTSVQPMVVCACGGECPQGGPMDSTRKLVEMLGKNIAFSNAEAQRLWLQINQYPEVRYLVMKALREQMKRGIETGPEVAKTIKEIEQGLSKLENETL